jgi:hypothetical protein
MTRFLDVSEQGHDTYVYGNRREAMLARTRMTLCAFLAKMWPRVHNRVLIHFIGFSYAILHNAPQWLVSSLLSHRERKSGRYLFVRISAHLPPFPKMGSRASSTCSSGRSLKVILHHDRISPRHVRSTFIPSHRKALTCLAYWTAAAFV